MLTSNFNNWDTGIFSVVGIPGGPTNTETTYWYRRDGPRHTDDIYLKSNTDITYKWNTYGFRSDEFVDDDRDSIIAIGDSFTMGLGSAVEHTWPEVLRTKFSDTKLYNLGLAVCSTDYVVRAIAKTIDVLRPRAVFVLWPAYSQREVAVGRRYLPYMSTLQQLNSQKSNIKYLQQGEYIFQDNNYIKYHFYKNRRMLQEICKNRKIPLQEFSQCENNDLDSWDIYAAERDYDPRKSDNLFESIGIQFNFPISRDGLHWGKEWHAYCANLFWSQYLINNM